MQTNPTYFNNYQNYREANLYYLIVGSISFGIVIYCCYQCQSQSRNDQEAFRARQLDIAQQQRTINQQQQTADDSLNERQLNNQFKASAPPLTPLVTQDLPTFRSTNELTNAQQQQINQINYVNNSSSGDYYPDELPPSYDEVVNSKQQINHH